MVLPDFRTRNTPFAPKCRAFAVLRSGRRGCCPGHQTIHQLIPNRWQDEPASGDVLLAEANHQRFRPLWLARPGPARSDVGACMLSPAAPSPTSRFPGWDAHRCCACASRIATHFPEIAHRFSSPGLYNFARFHLHVMSCGPRLTSSVS